MFIIENKSSFSSRLASVQLYFQIFNNSKIRVNFEVSLYIRRFLTFRNFVILSIIIDSRSQIPIPTSVLLPVVVTLSYKITLIVVIVSRFTQIKIVLLLFALIPYIIQQSLSYIIYIRLSPFPISQLFKTTYSRFFL